MSLKKMTKDELELYSYTDIAEIILSESKKPLSTVGIFTKIKELLELSEEEYKAGIGDFYTSLTTDKRFISLENAEWDLRDRHVIKIELQDDEDEDEESEEDEAIEDEESEEEDNYEEEVIDDLEDDDLEDLSIISDEELEEN